MEPQETLTHRLQVDKVYSLRVTSSNEVASINEIPVYEIVICLTEYEPSGGLTQGSCDVVMVSVLAVDEGGWHHSRNKFVPNYISSVF